ncbi:MAG: type II toxin-antitoxin system HicB family antitoxin [Bacteroidales bacterium]
MQKPEKTIAKKTKELQQNSRNCGIHNISPMQNFELLNKAYKMERIVNLHIEKLPEGYYLATSDSIQGLIAQGRTISETIEIAKDVAKKLIEAQEDSSTET